MLEMNSTLKKVIIIVIVYFIKYLSYILLTYCIIFVFASIAIFIISLFGSNISFDFMKYLAFLNPIFSQKKYTITTTEIMQIYSFLSLIIWGVIFFIKKLLEKIIKKEISISFKTKLRSGIITLTAILLIDILTIAFLLPNNEQNYIGQIFFIIAYVSSVISFIMYSIFNLFSKKIDESKQYI